MQKEHSGDIQETFREHTGNLQGNIQGTFREHSGNAKEHSGVIQKLPRNIHLRRKSRVEHGVCGMTARGGLSLRMRSHFVHKIVLKTVQIKHKTFNSFVSIAYFT
jgi:urocanate hydratase